MIEVPDDGRLDARLVLIGEAPAFHEVRQGRPFVGPSGYRLGEWWTPVGLSRRDFYITNVVPYRLPKDSVKGIDPGELAHWVERLHERLAALTDPWLIVPTGETALHALTGKRGISKHRGSIYGYASNGRTIKVIPTHHPAATFPGRQPSWEYRCKLDWQRIARDATFRELRLPEREHYIVRSLDDLAAVYEDLSRADLIAVDIETPRATTTVPVMTKSGTPSKRLKREFGDPYIACLAYAATATFSVTIPMTLAHWHEPAVLARVWEYVRAINALPVEKTLQNGLFDAWWLAQPEYDAPLAHFVWDTLGMHHCLDPATNHSLNYQASLYTRQPYWKDEAKDPDEIMKYASSAEALHVYCGLDACVGWELTDVHHRALADRDLMTVYRMHYADMLGPMLAAMLHGLRHDEAMRRRRWTLSNVERLDRQNQLTSIAGTDLYGPKGAISPKKLAAFLYDTLHLPEQRNRKTQRVTTREVTVRRLMLRFPKLREAGEAILRIRRVQKIMESYSAKVAAPDGRVYYSFNFTPETTRFSSTDSPKRHGRNIQNVDRETRDIYVPDDGGLLMNVDLSQAEDRIVKVKTGAPRLIERARAQPWENDEHRRAAAIIFRIAADAASGEQRYLGKRTRHATNYETHGQTLSDELLKDGYILPPDECEAHIEAIHAADPEIRAIYHVGCRKRVLATRTLTNTWGRSITFHERMNDDLFRRAYAFEPQSTVPSIINQWGWKPLQAMIEARGLRTRIHMQGHDSLLLSVPRDEAWLVWSHLRAWLERPRTYLAYAGPPVELTIPVSVSLGASWGAMHEWKRPPTRDGLDAKFAELAG